MQNGFIKIAVSSCSVTYLKKKYLTFMLDIFNQSMSPGKRICTYLAQDWYFGTLMQTLLKRKQEW